MKLFEAIAQNSRILDSRQFAEHAEKRNKRICDILPRGSGFDCGTKIETANDNRIVFTTSFHHMDENGFYDGWTEHRITVKACFIGGFDISISGRNKNEIKDYIHDVFGSVLNSDFDWVEK